MVGTNSVCKKAQSPNALKEQNKNDVFSVKLHIVPLYNLTLVLFLGSYLKKTMKDIIWPGH